MGLARMAARVAEETKENLPTITLHGPFRKYERGRGSPPDEIEGEYDGFVLRNGDFTEIAMDVAGADEEDREDFETGTYHTFTVLPTFHVEPSDPSVGITGGAMLDGVELVEIDGVVLENPDDERAVLAALKPYLDEHRDDWARDYAEAASEPPDFGYGA